MFLLIVDAHSKWMDIHITDTNSSQITINKLRQTFATFGLPKMIVTDNGSSFTSKEFQLRQTFATFGLPKMIVTDNGSSFTSKEFQSFMMENGIIHKRSSPYHPATNERAVQTFKYGIKKLSGPLELRLLKFRFKYRITPHSSTGVSPAELVFGLTLRSRLDLIYPDIGRKMNQQKVINHGRHLRTFQPDDKVYFRNFSSKEPKWIPAIIKQKISPVSYTIFLSDGRTIKRHVDHIQSRECPPNYSEFDDFQTSVHGSTNSEVSNESTSEPRRSTRFRRPPDRFSPSKY